MKNIDDSLYTNYSKIVLNKAKGIDENAIYYYIDLMRTNGFIPNPLKFTFINLHSDTNLITKYFKDKTKIDDFIKISRNRTKEISIEQIAKSYSNKFTFWEKINEITTILHLIITIILFTIHKELFFISTFLFSLKSWQSSTYKFWQEFSEYNSFNIDQKLRYRINYPYFYLYLSLLATLLNLVMIITYKVGFTFQIVKNEHLAAFIYIVFVIFYITVINAKIINRYSDLFMSNYLNKYKI